MLPSRAEAVRVADLDAVIFPGGGGKIPGFRARRNPAGPAAV